MANGEMLEEVRKIVDSQDPVSQSIVNKLSLSIIAEIYKTQKDNIADETIKHAKIDARVEKLEHKSILLWIEANKPIALALCVLTLIVLMTVPNILVAVISKALGVPYP